MPPTPSPDHLCFMFSLTDADESQCRPSQVGNIQICMDGALAIFLAKFLSQLHTAHPTWMELSSFFSGSFLARCVLCGRCIVQNSHLYGRNARNSFDTAFSSVAYCAAGAQQKTTVCIDIDGTLVDFSILLSDSLGTVRPFCFEKM